MALKELAARGIKVDIPDQVLPRQEFHRRMSQAWLAWSPSGFGWDCYRTGEAAQCLTVPVVNHPTVERYRPLLNGQHLIQYDIEGDGLARAVAVRARGQGAAQADGVGGARRTSRRISRSRAFASHIIETGLSFREVVR